MTSGIVALGIEIDSHHRLFAEQLLQPQRSEAVSGGDDPLLVLIASCGKEEGRHVEHDQDRRHCRPAARGIVVVERQKHETTAPAP